MSQLKLGALLFAGKKETIEVPEKRPPGRPKKVRDEPDASTVAAVEAEVAQVVVRNSELVLDPNPPMRCTERGPSQLRIAESLGDQGRRELEEVCEATGDDPEKFAPPGVVRGTRDETFGLSTKVRFLDWYKEKLKKVRDSELLLRVCARQVSRPVFALRAVVRKEKELRAELSKRHLTPTGLSKSDAAKAAWNREVGRRCKGEAKRGAGGGRKAKLEFLYPLVREWFETQRTNGFFVSPEDLVSRFARVVRTYKVRAEALQAKGVKLGEQEVVRLSVSMDLLEKHECRFGKSLERYWSQTLVKACGAVLRTPQRLCRLSKKQEKLRWVWTLRKWDETLFLSMGSDRAWLADRVVDVEGWLRGLATTEVLMSDQIPYWVKIGREKQLFMKDEIGEAAGKRGEKHLESQPGMSQNIGTEAETVGQTRQKGNSDAEKFRVTFEACQALSGLWTSAGELTVRQLRPLLVYPGGYGRLSNISEAGTFIQTERFIVRGKEVVRPAGSKVGSLMQSWRELRDQGTAEEKWIVSQFEVMQQPAGTQMINN